MSKAVLVMDMPESCYECPMLNGNDECILHDEDANAFYADDYDGLRKGCPLGYLPETKVYPNLELLHTLLEYSEYAKLGSVKELREAMEKQRAKKPILNKTVNIYFCPICERRVNYAHSMFCSGCGQAIDWRKND